MPVVTHLVSLTQAAGVEAHFSEFVRHAHASHPEFAHGWLNAAREMHPYVAERILREQGWPEEIIGGVRAHAPFTGEPRDTPLKRTIFAVDELSGFITACALVYERDLSKLDPARVRRKLKDKSFAKQVSRDDIRVGLEELGGDAGDQYALVVINTNGRKDSSTAEGDNVMKLNVRNVTLVDILNPEGQTFEVPNSGTLRVTVPKQRAMVLVPENQKK